jgi:hypothetical protein
MAMALRNGGSGLAVIHGWQVAVGENTTSVPVPATEDFRRQQRDLYTWIATTHGIVGQIKKLWRLAHEPRASMPVPTID